MLESEREGLRKSVESVFSRASFVGWEIVELIPKVRQLRDFRALSFFLQVNGLAALDGGVHEIAKRDFQELQLICSDYPEFRSYLHFFSARLNIVEGNVDAGIANLHACLNEITPSLHFRIRSQVYDMLACVYHDHGDFDHCLRFAEACIKVSDHPKLRVYKASALLNIAEVVIELDDCLSAVELARTAYELLDGFGLMRATALCIQCKALLTIGDFEAASPLLNEAYELATRLKTGKTTVLRVISLQAIARAYNRDIQSLSCISDAIA